MNLDHLVILGQPPRTHTHRKHGEVMLTMCNALTGVLVILFQSISSQNSRIRLIHPRQLLNSEIMNSDPHPTPSPLRTTNDPVSAVMHAVNWETYKTFAEYSLTGSDSVIFCQSREASDGIAWQVKVSPREGILFRRDTVLWL